MNLKFAVVGAGPAGFSMAKLLLQHVPQSTVDIIDRNPHPFGLIRTGMAPDHQAMKNIQNDCDTTMRSFPDRIRFLGNVWVGDISPVQPDYDLASVHGGKCVSIADLRDSYSGVVLAHGATKDR